MSQKAAVSSGDVAGAGRGSMARQVLLQAPAASTGAGHLHLCCANLGVIALHVLLYSHNTAQAFQGVQSQPTLD